MANDNGNGFNNKIMFIISIGGGVIFIVVVIYNLIFLPLSNAVQDECHKRIAQDNENCQAFQTSLEKLANKVDGYHDEAIKANIISVASLARIEERLGIQNGKQSSR